MESPILIAGFGYLGQALGERLRRRGIPFTGLVKSNSTGLGQRSNPVESCDLSDPDSVAELGITLSPAPGAIVHCASSGRGGPEAYRAVFVDGVRHLQQVFPGIPLLLTSSTSVYGQTDGSVVTEASLAKPDRETGRLLREAEDLVLGKGGTVLRLAGLYGPGRSIYLKRFLQGEAAIESGAVSRHLNQIHRDDAAAAIDHLLDLGPAAVAGEIFNVSDDDDKLTQRSCYEKLAAFFDRPVPPETLPDPNRKRGLTDKRVSNEKLRQTDWKPRYPGFFAALDNDPDLIPSIRAQISQP